MGNLISTISGILVPHHVSSIYDPDALAFFNAVEGAGGVLTLTEKSVTNQLVLDFKANGTWSKKLAIYPMVGGSAISQSFNLKNPALYRLLYHGAITHSAAGMKFNAASASFADTQLTDILWNTANVHLSVWNTEDIDADTAETGFWLSGGRIFIQSKSSGQIVGGYASYSLGPVPTSVGMSTVDYGSSLLQVFKNGAVIASSTQPNVGVVNRSIIIGGLYDGVVALAPSNKMCAYAEYGRTQTGTETLNDYYFVQAFQTGLSRRLGAAILLLIPLLLGLGIVLTSQQTYDLNLLLESLPAPSARQMKGMQTILPPVVKDFLIAEGYKLNF